MSQASVIVSESPRSTSDLDMPVPRCECGRCIDLDGMLEQAMTAACLTAKERVVCKLVFKGFQTVDMVAVTGNTYKTLKSHVAEIFKKFGVSSRSELFHAVFPV